MASTQPPSSFQACAHCGHLVDLRGEEPLASVACPHCGETIRVERAFDHFLLLENVGGGGMGSVYKARDTRLDRLVALKLLRKDLSADTKETARLQAEARATAAVNHPHVVQVFSSGTDHGQFYLVMELVDHGSLDDRMAQDSRIAEVQVLLTGIQVAEGLQAAHAKGLIHRDIKPGNILFTDPETAKIGDFGLAAAAGSASENQNEIWGTPCYVAPERLNNELEDLRSDIYSLGATLFHALSGRPPFDGETDSATALRELKERPIELAAAAPDISAGTAKAIMRMIAPDPAQRFQSYSEVIAALQRPYRKLTGADVAGTRAKLLLVVAIVTILAAGLGAFVYNAKLRRLRAEAASRARELNVPVNRMYDEARAQLIAGKYDLARSAFTRLSTEAQGHQPLLNWIRLHRGLAALLRGYRNPAREAFQEVEGGGFFSAKPQDAGLAKFFVETARTVSGPDAIDARGAATIDPQTPAAFALLLFAFKDWQQRDFPNASALLERYLRTESAGEFSWINEYKPLAQKYLADYRVHTEAKEQSQHARNSGDLTNALNAIRNAENKLQTRGALLDSLKENEAALSRETLPRSPNAAPSQPAPNRAAGQNQTPAGAAWLTNSRRQIASYDFPGALATIRNASVGDASLKPAQLAAAKKAQWLIDWKNQLIGDINSHAFEGSVTDVGGANYEGSISRATTARLTIKMAYGIVELEWAKLSPQTLLAVARSYIRPPAADIADRQWRSAVFAHETGLRDEAHTLSDAAANANPAYREELSVLAADTIPAP